MARKLQMKRGSKINLPALAAGEPAVTLDEGKLYIGASEGNVGLARDDHIHSDGEDIAVSYAEASTLAELNSGESLGSALGKLKKAVSTVISHVADDSNPHGVTAAQIGAASTAHTHSASDISSGVLSAARGGTGVSSMVGTDYSANRPRGIILQESEPSSVSNGCIVGVYE